MELKEIKKRAREGGGRRCELLEISRKVCERTSNSLLCEDYLHKSTYVPWYVKECARFMVMRTRRTTQEKQEAHGVGLQ